MTRAWEYEIPGVEIVPTANTLNRMHWRVRNRTAKQPWRQHGMDAWGVIGRPRCERFTVELHYRPATRRRRDAENYLPVVKYVVDGLVNVPPAKSGLPPVGVGIAVDDDDAHYVSSPPVIHEPVKGQPGRVWLRIVDLSEEA